MANQLPIGCFGKVPFWREYLEHGVVHPSSRAFRQWLREGNAESSLEEPITEPFANTKVPADSEPAQGRATDRRIRNRLRFLIGAPGSAELLVGVVRPSRDGGGRHFPFTTFTHIPRKLYGKHHNLLPLALAPLWDVLDDAWTSLANVASKSAFDELLGELTVPGPVSVGDARGIYQGRQQDDPARLFDRKDGASIAHLDRNLVEFLAELRKSSGAGLQVMLPVSSDLEEAAFDVCFWLDLINRQFLLKRFEPDLFLGSAPDLLDRHAIFKFGGLSTADFPLIMGLTEDEDRVKRPAHPELQVAESPGPPVALEVRTYAEILQHRFR